MSDLSNMTSAQRDPQKVEEARALSVTSRAAAARAAAQATQVALTLSEFLSQGMPADSPHLQRELDAWRALYDEAVEANRRTIAAWDATRAPIEPDAEVTP